MHRRDLLKFTAAAGIASLAKPGLSLAAEEAAEKGTKIVFLGTKGGPRVGLGRSNPANLIMVNGTPIVLDCGMGVTHQLVAAGVPPQTVKYILISHLHSDHDLEFGNLIYNAWASGLKTPIHAFGPKGLKAMTQAYWEVNKFDIETRIKDEGRPDLRKLAVVDEVDDDGVVFKTDDVTVTAFRTPHPPITDNFAYKFETADGSVVFSSDTNYNPKLGEFAKGADVLVHETLYVPGIEGILKKVKNGASLKEHLLASHTTTEDIGRIAAIAKPKLLVLSHLVPGDNPSITDEEWTAGVKKHFDGDVVVAKDLMELKLPV